MSYHACAQMLSQTKLGTECSLSHFQKTSYLLWQQPSGKRQKKERSDKDKANNHCLLELVWHPHPQALKTVLIVLNFFLRSKTLFNEASLFSQKHKRNDSFLVGENSAVPHQLSSFHILFRFRYVVDICCYLYHDNADSLITQHFIEEKGQQSQIVSICTDMLCWSHLPCLWIKDSPCNIWNVMFLTTDSGSNLFLQQRRLTHDDSSWPK